MTSAHPYLETKTIKHEFVDRLPAIPVEGVLYISIPFCVASHLCFCGCGTKVILPLSPQSWHLTFDGDTVSILPSIGNWSLPCRSHYWIDRDRVIFIRMIEIDKAAEA